MTSLLTHLIPRTPPKKTPPTHLHATVYGTNHGDALARCATPPTTPSAPDGAGPSDANAALLRVRRGGELVPFRRRPGDRLSIKMKRSSQDPDTPCLYVGVVSGGSL